LAVTHTRRLRGNDFLCGVDAAINNRSFYRAPLLWNSRLIHSSQEQIGGMTGP